MKRPKASNKQTHSDVTKPWDLENENQRFCYIKPTLLLHKNRQNQLFCYAKPTDLLQKGGLNKRGTIIYERL